MCFGGGGNQVQPYPYPQTPVDDGTAALEKQREALFRAEALKDTNAKGLQIDESGATDTLGKGSQGTQVT